MAIREAQLDLCRGCDFFMTILKDFAGGLVRRRPPPVMDGLNLQVICFLLISVSERQRQYGHGAPHGQMWP